jgi:dihydropteroate synthase
VISLAELVRLATQHADDLDLPVAPFTVGDQSFDTDRRPAVMGVLNLSPDSWYRHSVVTSPANAVRRGRVLAAQGADFVDIGAESSDAPTARVDADAQTRALVPVIEELADEGVTISVESYAPAVVRASLEAGARIINLTGSEDDDVMFDLAAEHGASVVLCHILGANARELDETAVDPDPLPGMLTQFERRVATARARGVQGLAIDPGLGFGFLQLPDPVDRARHQSVVLLNSFRLRRLGIPVCHAMPSAFDLFEDQFRTAEGFFTVLAALGGTGVFRTHEVPHVVAVLDAMRELSVAPDPG